MALFQTQGKKFEAVGLLCALEDGLTKNHIIHMLSILSDDQDVEYIPFEFSANNSSVIGFMTVEAYDDHLNAVQSMLENLCDDWTNSRKDKTYTTESGFEVFVDCECELIV